MQLKEIKLEEIKNKSISVTQAAKELGVSRKTIYKWINAKKLLEGGDTFSTKASSAHNKISSQVEQWVIENAKNNPDTGIVDLSLDLEREHNIKLDKTTIYRILKRNNIRYTKKVLPTVPVTDEVTL